MRLYYSADADAVKESFPIDLAAIASLLAEWQPSWELWSVCRELADGEIERRDSKRFLLGESLRDLSERMRGRRAAVPVRELPVLVSSLTWSQVQHLVVWAECGCDEEAAAQRLGVGPGTVGGALEYTRLQLAGR